jgi:hypothetical protein
MLLAGGVSARAVQHSVPDGPLDGAAHAAAPCQWTSAGRCLAASTAAAAAAGLWRSSDTASSMCTCTGCTSSSSGSIPVSTAWCQH